MLDVHPPEHTPHTWRDFFIHIATIVIGLLIAIGLEQTVEYIHHRHLRHELDAQIQEVLHDDLSAITHETDRLGAFRSYLTEQQAAVVAHRAGRSVPAPPPSDDPRMIAPQNRFPSLAPYEAAKENGTVGVLPGNEIRLYDRIGLQRELLLAQSNSWHGALVAWESFQERFVDSKGAVSFGGRAGSPRLDQLSPAEVIEFQTLIATLIKETDVLSERLRYFDNEARSILKGNRDEDKLIDSVLRPRTRELPVTPAPGSDH
jgi:hypothetical protein